MQLNSDDDFYVVEQKAFGTSHLQVGAQLLKQQGVNNFICDAVLFHHESVDQIYDAHPLLKIVKLANILTNSNFNEQNLQIFDVAEELLSLNKTQILEMLEKAQLQVKNSAQLLGVEVARKDKFGKTTHQLNSYDNLKQTQLEEQVRGFALLNGVHHHLFRNEDQHNNF